MGTLASCPNVAVKISGLGQPGQPWTVAANRDIVLTTIDLFGPSRCMFASNFPVDSLCASFHTIFGGFREIVRDFSAGEQRGLFHDNAIRIYGMDVTMAPIRIGYVGVGLMGLPMVRRLVSLGYAVVAYDIVATQVAAARRQPARTAASVGRATRCATPSSSCLNLPTTDAVEQAVFGDRRRRDAPSSRRSSSSISRPTRSHGARPSRRDCASKPAAAGSTRRSRAARRRRARAR